nr:peptidoglycan DD-metalloendopeptidase family protein [uncultured Cohaesibacter sp.]
MIRSRNRHDNKARSGSRITVGIQAMTAAATVALCLSIMPPLQAQNGETSDKPTSTDKAAPETADPAKTEAEQRAARALEARLAARKQQEEALTEIEASIALSNERQQELKEEIEQLRSDRETIQQDLLATAERIKDLESSLSDRETRLRTLFADQTNLRVSLAEQRDSLSEILAALQRIGRNPPPALFIRPNEALSAVRSAILLSTLVPEVRLEAQSLAAQLEALIRLQTKIEQEKTALQGGLGKLQEERERLDLLVAKRKEQEATSLEAARSEEEKTSQLAARARSLQELIDGMEKEIKAARLAVEEAKEAEKRQLEKKLETKKQKIAALKDAARLSPAIPFSKMKGLLQLPARGTVLKSYGSNDGFGGQTQGLSIATRIGAQVTSPADGWIVYAGPFRSFGKLLIINAGDGYHIVLSGMDNLIADVGSFVLANEPVGTMQKTRLAATDVLDSGASRPVLYLELRKDGAAIDPAPWWTVALKEKADG